MSSSKITNILNTIFLVMGFISMMSQLIVLRELMIVFTGNELTIGIIIGLWLLWTAAGSGIVGTLSRFSFSPLKLFIVCQSAMVILLPLTIMFIRLSKTLFLISWGEITSPVSIFLIPFLALAPICLLIGFLFALSCKALSQVDKDFSKVPGKVYFLEAIGSGMAGFIVSMILFRFLENFQVVIIICIVNIFSLFLLFYILNKKQAYRLIPIFVLCSFLLLLFLPSLDQFTLKKFWGSLKLLESKNSIYGNISITQLGESVSFFENGKLIFTHPDLMHAEEEVHFALLEHPNPKNILLIGGDATGIFPQIFYHPGIKQIDFILLDPNSLKLAKKYLPDLKKILLDKRIKVYFQDGRFFLKRTLSKYDVIIVNLPPPQTTLINRFYTVEFFEIARKRLNEGGVISFSIPSSENLLSNEQAKFASCLFNTMTKIFDKIVLIPGNSIHFIGCTSSNILTENVNILIDRIEERKLPTVFIRDYYLHFRMSQGRMEYIANKVLQFPTTTLNRDFHPIGYFYNIYLWLTSFDKKMIGTINDLFKFGIYFISLIGLIIFLILLFSYRISQKNKTTFKYIIITSIMAIGCTAISLEVLIIHGFQAIYGYAYYQLSLIITGFMIGLALGSWFGQGYFSKSRDVLKRFLLFQILMMIYPIFTFVVLVILLKATLSTIIIQIIFFLLISIVGFIGGHQFPAANFLIVHKQGKIDNIGGTLYAWDLVGSVIGALVISTVMIPLLGIGNTCFVFSGLNLIVIIFLLINLIFLESKP